MKYEYKTEYLSSSGERREDDVLKQSGDDGWELVAVIDGGSFGESWEKYYFKRIKL